MSWNLEETIAWYKNQGAPGDQTVVISLLREVQRENGGRIPLDAVGSMAAGLGVRESFLVAVIRRIPSLRLGDLHCLEICAGANCGRHRKLASFAERINSERISVRFVPCMRQCGKGPNIRWDGTVYNQADEALIQKLIEKIR